MPVEPVAHPCEVCGVETTQRCSSCVKAGIDLFFCSKDHQKLVWPAHKTFCGPGKAHPIVIIALSMDELAWIQGHLDVLITSTGSTLRETLEVMGRTDEPAEALLHGLVSGAWSSKSSHNKFMLLTGLRIYLASRPENERIATTDVTTGSDGAKTSFDKYLAAEYCATIIHPVSLLIAESGRVELDLDHAEWYSLIQHKAFLISGLEQLSQVGDQPLQQVEWASQMKRRLFEWIRAGAGCADARMRGRLAEFRGPGEAQSL